MDADWLDMTHHPASPASPHADDPTPVGLPTRRRPSSGAWATSPVERLLVERLGGIPWTGPDPTGRTHQEALARWAELRTLLEYDDISAKRWMTLDSAKFDKTRRNTDVVPAGVTLLSATGARTEWASLTARERSAWAEVLEYSVDDIDELVRHTVCERSTKGCRDGCVVARSRNAQNGTTPLTRLARTLLTLAHPAESLELTRAALDEMVVRHGADDVRWRMNIGDDVRWECIAPGMLGVAAAYAYTKHAPAARPEMPGLTRIVYSASERWSDAQILESCGQGHTVAVVFTTRRNQVLPTTWRGTPVVDGDATDDLWTHPHGVIVGLTVKGPDNATIEAAIRSGFARPV